MFYYLTFLSTSFNPDHLPSWPHSVSLVRNTNPMNENNVRPLPKISKCIVYVGIQIHYVDDWYFQSVIDRYLKTWIVKEVDRKLMVVCDVYHVFSLLVAFKPGFQIITAPNP